MDLPDPEVLLADPAGAALPERGDLRQAVLDGVVEAVRGRPEKSRWDAAWALLVRAVETGAPARVVVLVHPHRGQFLHRCPGHEPG